MNVITIVIPVHNAARELKLCLDSVFSHTALSEKRRLLVIDDGSDEAEIENLLASLPGPFVKTMKNPHNIGYTGTINHAISACPHDDIALLNSDTIVTPGWLEKLHAHALSSPAIGTVTPVSNNAGVFSVPKPGKNELPKDMTIDEMAMIVENCGRDQSFDAPTGNGFCLYIKRSLLEAIGYFDDINFPKGYGEENDFCMRAGYAGFRNIVALDTYIWHSAHASFGGSRKVLMRRGLEMMAALYPDYHKLTRVFATNTKFADLRLCVLAHVAGAPGEAPGFLLGKYIPDLWQILRSLKKGCEFSASAFRYLLRHGSRQTSNKIGKQMRYMLGADSIGEAIGRLKTINDNMESCDEFERRHVSFIPAGVENPAQRKKILDFMSGAKSLECVIDHNCGGGANSYSYKLINNSLKNGNAVLNIAHAPATPFIYATLFAGTRKILFKLDGLESLKWFPIEKIIINELVSWFQKDNGETELLAARNVTNQLVDYVKSRNIAMEFLVHDYYCVCPCYTLINAGEIFCGIPDHGECGGCIKNFLRGSATITEWRGAFAHLFAHTNNIVCFSEASRNIITKIFPAASPKIEVCPHAPLVDPDRAYDVPSKGPMTVGVVGNIGPHKGLKIVKELAGLLSDGERLIIIGECPRFTRQKNVVFHGTYQRENLADIFAHYGVTVGLVPSVWPETFCYVAQECMQLGLPLVTFDLGAQGERTKAYEKGLVAPEISAKSALATLRELDARRFAPTAKHA